MYTVVTSNTLGGLSEKVDQKMLDGYTPQGGVCLAFGPSGYSHYCQAMIKTEGNAKIIQMFPKTVAGRGNVPAPSLN